MPAGDYTPEVIAAGIAIFWLIPATVRINPFQESALANDWKLPDDW
jgi:hypothetical protein